MKRFHLGGDEARTLGQNPDTKAYVKEHGKGALYLQHVGPILDHLNARHIRPILWHDMMVDWDSKQLQALAAKCDLMVWGYMGNPETTKGNFSTKVIQAFSRSRHRPVGRDGLQGSAKAIRANATPADRPVLAGAVAPWPGPTSRNGQESDRSDRHRMEPVERRYAAVRAHRCGTRCAGRRSG